MGAVVGRAMEIVGSELGAGEGATDVGDVVATALGGSVVSILGTGVENGLVVLVEEGVGVGGVVRTMVEGLLL